MLLLPITSDDEDGIKTAQRISSISVSIPTLSETNIEIVGHEIKSVNSPTHVCASKTSEKDDNTNDIHSENKKSKKDDNNKNTNSNSFAFTNVENNEDSCRSSGNMPHTDDNKNQNEDKPVPTMTKKLAIQQINSLAEQTSSHVIRKINLHQVVNAAPSQALQTLEQIRLPVDVESSHLSDTNINTDCNKNPNDNSANKTRNTEAANMSTAVVSAKMEENCTLQTSNSINNYNDTTKSEEYTSHVTSSPSSTLHHEEQKQQLKEEYHLQDEKNSKESILQLHNAQEILPKQEAESHMSEPTSLTSSQSHEHSQSYVRPQPYTSLQQQQQQQQQRRYATRRLRNAPLSIDLPLALPISQSCCQTPLTHSTATTSCFNSNMNTNEHLNRSKSLIFDNNNSKSNNARWRSTQRECRSCEQESHHSIHSLIRGLRQNSIREIFPHLNPLFILPRERVFVYRSTSKQLGKGAYGVVMYGELYPPSPTEQEITQEKEQSYELEKEKKKEENKTFSENIKYNMTESETNNMNIVKSVKVEYTASCLSNNSTSSKSKNDNIISVNDIELENHEITNKDGDCTYNNENKKAHPLTSSNNVTNVKNERLVPLLPLPPQHSISPSSMELHYITTTNGTNGANNRYHINSFPSAPLSQHHHHHHHHQRSLSHNITPYSTHSSSHSSTSSLTFSNNYNNISTSSDSGRSSSNNLKSGQCTPMHLMPYSEFTASFYSRQSHSCNSSRAVTPVKCNATRASSSRDAKLFINSNRNVMGDSLSRQNSKHIEYNCNNNKDRKKKDGSVGSTNSSDISNVCHSVRHTTRSLPASVHSSEHVSVSSELSVYNTSNCANITMNKSQRDQNKSVCDSITNDNLIEVSGAAMCVGEYYNRIKINSERNVSCDKTDTSKTSKLTFTETPLTIPLAQITTSEWRSSLLCTEDHVRDNSVVSRSTTFSSAERSTSESNKKSNHNGGNNEIGRRSNLPAIQSSKAICESDKTTKNIKNIEGNGNNKHENESVSSNEKKYSAIIKSVEAQCKKDNEINTHNVSSSENEKEDDKEDDVDEDDEAYMDENMSPVSALSPEFSTLCDVSLSRSSPSPIVLPIRMEASLQNMASKNVFGDNDDKSEESGDNESEAIATKANSNSKSIEYTKEQENKVAADVERDSDHAKWTKDFLTEAKMTIAISDHNDDGDDVGDDDDLHTNNCCNEEKGSGTVVDSTLNTNSKHLPFTINTNTTITSNLALAWSANDTSASIKVNEMEEIKLPRQSGEQSDEKVYSNQKKKDVNGTYFASSNQQQKASSANAVDNVECKSNVCTLPTETLSQETISIEEMRNKDNNDDAFCKSQKCNESDLLASNYCEADIALTTRDKEKTHIHVPELHRTEQLEKLPSKQTNSLRKTAATTCAHVQTSESTNTKSKTDLSCISDNEVNKNSISSADKVECESNSKDENKNMIAINNEHNAMEKCEVTKALCDMKRYNYNNNYKNEVYRCKIDTGVVNKALLTSPQEITPSTEVAMTQSNHHIVNKHPINENCVPFHAVAVKVVCKTDLMRPVFDEAVHNEVHMASHLHHPCLINYFGITEDAENLLLVMDLSENGNLKEYQSKFGVADTREMAPRFMADIVLALEYFRDEVQHPFSPRSTPINSVASAHSMFANRCNTICYSTNSNSVSSNNNGVSVPFTGHAHHFTRSNHLPLSKSLFDLSSMRSQNSARRRERSLEHSHNLSRSNNNNNMSYDSSKNAISTVETSTMNVSHEQRNSNNNDDDNDEQKSKCTHEQSEPSCAIQHEQTTYEKHHEKELQEKEEHHSLLSSPQDGIPHRSIVLHRDLKPENMTLT